MYIYIYIHVESFIQKRIQKYLLNRIKCKCMTLNVGMNCLCEKDTDSALKPVFLKKTNQAIWVAGELCPQK